MSTLHRSHGFNATAKAASTFELFPKLPLELQQEIWQLAAQEEADSTPARIKLIAPEKRGTRYPRRLPVLDANLRYRPKSYYPEIQLRLVHRSHTLPGLFSACQASRNAITPFYSVWEKDNGGNVYVNEKRDVIYFKGPRHWLLHTIHAMRIQMASEDDQIAGLQHMVQLQGCHNLAFDMNMVPCGPRQHSESWLRTFTNMKTMLVVINAQGFIRKKISDGSRFVVPSGDSVIREALMAYPWNFTLIDRITQIFHHDVVRQAGVNIPKLEFVLISDPEVEEKWSKDLLVHSI